MLIRYLVEVDMKKAFFKTFFSILILCYACLFITSCNQIVKTSDLSITNTPNFVSISDTCESLITSDNKWVEDIIVNEEIICHVNADILISNETTSCPVYQIKKDSFRFIDVNKLFLAFGIDEIDLQSFQPPNKTTYVINGEDNYNIILYNNYISIQEGPLGIIQLEDWVKAGGAFPGEPQGTELENVIISKEDAVNIASIVLSEIGVSDLFLSSSQKARILLEDNTTLNEGWYLTYSRNDGYLPKDLANFSSKFIIPTKSEMLTALCQPESLSLYINEDGVQSICWRNRITITDTISYDSSIIEFCAIQEIVRQSIYNTYGNKIFNDIDCPQLFDIALIGCIVADQKDPSIGYIVPAWMFSFTNDHDKAHYYMPYIVCINATNGDRLDPLTTKYD